jgi:steroid 5-alpha reductase family enzyme
MTNSLLLGLGIILIFLTSLKIYSLVLNNNRFFLSFCFGPSIFILSIYYFFITDGFLLRKALIIALVSIWGLGLPVLTYFGYKGYAEKFGDQILTNKDINKFDWSKELIVVLFFGSIFLYISVPILYAQYFPGNHELNMLDYLGIILWVIGFLFEFISENQSTKFHKNNLLNNAVMQSGLWRYTQNPVYFGVSCIWWGFYFISFAALGSVSWRALSASIIVTCYFFFFSYKEKRNKSLQKEYPEYYDYVEKTSAFFPWFPKRKKMP